MLQLHEEFLIRKREHKAFRNVPLPEPVCLSTFPSIYTRFGQGFYLSDCFLVEWFSVPENWTTLQELISLPLNFHWERFLKAKIKFPSSPFTSFLAFLWTHSRTVTPFFNCGAQNCTHYSRPGCTNAEYSEIITSSDCGEKKGCGEEISQTFSFLQSSFLYSEAKQASKQKERESSSSPFSQ